MNMYIVRLIFYFRSFELNNWWMATFNPKPGSFAAYCLVLWGGVCIFYPEVIGYVFLFCVRWRCWRCSVYACCYFACMYEATRGQ